MPRRTAAARRPPLSRAAIAEAALGLIDEEGVESLSMRRLAARLGVEAMSLYNHVRDKRDLVEAVVNLVLARIPPPATGTPWRTRLETMALGLYGTLAQHPGVVLALLREEARPVDPAVLSLMDQAFDALAEAGLAPPRQVSAFRSVMAMCLGFVLAHTQGFARTPEKAEAVWSGWDATQYDATGLVRLMAIAPHFLSTRPHDDLRFTLGTYLDALEREARP